MYIDNFEIALREFDRVLDQLAHAKKNGEVITVESSDCPCHKHKFGTDITKDIKQVIFNDPATIVTFADGSKVCVKACKNDKFSKELGLVYAILKRVYADGIDDNGYFKASGLGENLNRIIAGAIDQKVIEANAKAEREAKKAKKTEAKKVENKDDKADVTKETKKTNAAKSTKKTNK